MEKSASRNIDTFKEDTTKNKYLSFIIGEEEYGIEISCVKEIINIVTITQVPSTPNYIKGIINLRGDIIPVIDIRTRFFMEEKSYDELTCVIVIEHQDNNIGLIVDSVTEVKYIKESDISLPPSTKLSFSNQFIKNLGRMNDKVILLLELDKLLYDE